MAAGSRSAAKPALQGIILAFATINALQDKR